jgi:hypothetical protein
MLKSTRMFDAAEEVTGDFEAAMTLYESAIDSARKYGFTNYEALGMIHSNTQGHTQHMAQYEKQIIY